MEIVYYVASSLDGYIATPDGDVDWLEAFTDGGEDYGFADFDASIEALLMGSRTYEFALAQPSWPTPGKPSWVFTERDLPIAHPTVTLTRDSPEEVVAFLAQEGLRRAWLMGGGALAASFRDAGLITELVISVIPALLGNGIPLFAPAAAGLDHRPLELVSAKTYPSGVVQLTYRAETGNARA